MKQKKLHGFVAALYLALASGAQSAPPTNATSQVSLAAAKREIGNGNTAAAIIELKNAVRADPGNSEARYELAVLYLNDSNPAPALQEVEAARGRAYDENKILPLLAQCYLALGRFKDVLTKIPVAGLKGDVKATVLSAQARANIALQDYKAASPLVDEALRINPSLTGALVASTMLLNAEGKIDEAEAQAAKAGTSGSPLELLVLKGELRQKKNDLDGAAKYFDQAVKAFPKHMVARVQRASVNIARNKMPEADQDITWVLGQDPRQPLALFMRAYLLARDRNFHQAKEILQGLTQLSDYYPPVLLLLGEATLHDGGPELALDYTERYVRSQPNDVNGHKLLALIHQRMGHSAKAVSELEPLARTYPEDNQLKLQLAGALLESGRSEEAIKAFQRGVVADPGNTQAQLGMAIGQLSVGKTQQALAGIGKIIEADPGSPQANTLLILTQLQMRQTDNAFQAANAMIKANEADPNAYNLQGTVYLSTNNLSSARKSFQAALQRNPKFIPAVLNLARVEDRSGNVAGAGQWYEKAIAIDAANLTAYDGLAELALRTGDVDGATAHLKQAIARDAAAPAPRLHLVEMLLEHKRTSQALIEARDMFNALPQSPQAIDALARAQISNGETINGLASYERLVSQNPQNPEAQRRLGRAFIAAGVAEPGAAAKYAEDARASFERAVALAPEDLSLLADRLEAERRISGPDAALALAQKYVDARPTSAARLILLGDIQTIQKRGPAAAVSYHRAWETSKTSLTTLRFYASLMQEAKGDEAAKLLKDWTGAHPTDYDARFLLANYYLANGMTPEALAETEILSVVFPDNPTLLNNLAWLYTKQDPAKAISIAEKAYHLAPQSPDVLDTLGWLRVLTAAAEKGEILLQKAHEIAPARGDIGFHYAVALDRNHRPTVAKGVLEKILNGNAKFEARAEAEALLNKLSATR